MRVQREVGSQQAASIRVVVMVHFIHVVRRVPDLHIYAPVCHRLPLDAFPPVCVSQPGIVNRIRNVQVDMPFGFAQRITPRYLARLTTAQLFWADLKADCNQKQVFYWTCWNKPQMFHLWKQRCPFIYKKCPIAHHLLLLRSRSLIHSLTFASVCRWKHLLPPSRSRLPAGPEEQW